MKRTIVRLMLTIITCFVFVTAVFAADLAEDFDTGFDRWEILDEPGANSGPSDWQIVPEVGDHTNVLSPKSNIYGGPAENFEPARGTWAVYRDGDWAEAVIFADMHFTDDDIPGIGFRWVDENNHYIFDLMQQPRTGKDPFKRLRKVVNGNYTELAVEHDGGYDNDTWYTVRVEYSGSSIKVYWNDGLLFDVVDNQQDLPSGTIALSSWGMTDVFFDNITVNPVTAVQPAGKLSQTWATIKSRYSGEF